MMKKRISSRMTWWLKWGNPLFAIGFCMVWLVIASIRLPPDPVMLLIAMIAPLIAVIAILALTRRFIHPIADKVWDDGDVLIVRRNGQEERIALTNIVNVSYGQLNGVPKVTLLLREPSRFGERISYLPVIGSVMQAFFPLFQGEPKAVQDLIRRVDAARRQ